MTYEEEIIEIPIIDKDKISEWMDDFEKDEEDLHEKAEDLLLALNDFCGELQELNSTPRICTYCSAMIRIAIQFMKEGSFDELIMSNRICDQPSCDIEECKRRKHKNQS